MRDRRPWWQQTSQHQKRKTRGLGKLSWSVLGLGLAVTVGGIWSTPVGGSIAAAAGEVAQQVPVAAGQLPIVSALGSPAKPGNGTSVRTGTGTGTGTGGRPSAPIAPISSGSGSEDDERASALDGTADSASATDVGAKSDDGHSTGAAGASPTASTTPTAGTTPATGITPVTGTAPTAGTTPSTGATPGTPLTGTTPVSGTTIGPSAPPLTPSVQSLLASRNRYFGVYTADAPFSWREFDSVSAQLDYQPQIVGYFQGWDTPFRSDAVKAAWQHGQAPMLTWEPEPSTTGNNVINVPGYSLENIINGDFDVYLHNYARSISSTRLPVVIRLAHEMNSTWYPWAEDDGHGNFLNGNKQGDFVRMWQHVHDIFQAEGANRYVAWLWSPNIINNLTKSHMTEPYLRSLYPGDDYVDLVGLSGYLRPDYKPDNTFTFSYTFDRSLAQLRSIAPSKRILLSEIGSSDIGGHKAVWTQSVFDALQSPANDDVLGIVWFDRVISTVLNGAPLTNDFRIESDPSALETARAGLESGVAGFGPLPAR